jgi:hypothetical protein
MKELFLENIEDGQSEISTLYSMGVGLEEMEYLIQEKINEKLNSS